MRVDETVSPIVTTGCQLVVLLDNGPTAPWIRPDLPGRPRRIGGGGATAITSPDKAAVEPGRRLCPRPAATTIAMHLLQHTLDAGADASGRGSLATGTVGGRTRPLDGGGESRAVCHKRGADVHWVLCGLLRHRWRTETGEAGDSYQICDRCGRYRSRVSWTHVQEDHSTPKWHPPSDFSG